VAVGPAPVGTRGAVGRRLILAALGASFVGGQARGLRALLHGDLIVQPPEPVPPVGVRRPRTIWTGSRWSRR
jgi:hypothetical protein